MSILAISVQAPDLVSNLNTQTVYQKGLSKVPQLTSVITQNKLSNQSPSLYYRYFNDEK
jgi:hypothetical protein